MVKTKSKKPSWIDIKKSIGKFDHLDLIELVKDLYQLSEENKSFLHARCLGGDKTIKSYKNIILNSLYPDNVNENEDLEFGRAIKAIKEYAKVKARINRDDTIMEICGVLYLG